MTETPNDPAGIVTRPSAGSVSETVARLTEILASNAVRLFTVIDHSGEAAKAGLTMPDTKLVVFGNPAAGTPVMVAAPLAALDLPLKILIWQHADGATRVSYTSPAELAERHHLGPDLQARLEPVSAIADALVSA
jgi:uncharacterized protein (DUF302 family)